MAPVYFHISEHIITFAGYRIEPIKNTGPGKLFQIEPGRIISLMILSTQAGQ